MDGQSRRHNIVVAGIKDTGKERLSDLEEKVRKLFTEKLQLDHLKKELDWAHRTVVVRFQELKDKLAVLDKAKNEFWPLPSSLPLEAVQQKRKELLPAIKAT